MSGESARPTALGHLAVGIAATAVLIVVYFTMFPFDFVSVGRSPAAIVRRFSLTTGPPWGPREMPANTVLFVPLGLGLGGLARGRGLPRRSAWLAATLLGLAVSATIEVTQSAWLLRDPSIDDIVANGIGTALGAWLWTRSEVVISDVRHRVAVRSRTRTGRLVWVALSLVPTMLVTLAVVGFRHDTQLSGWDAGYPLAVGNEPTGDRPWRGAIATLSLADRSLTDRETAELLAGRPMEDVASGSTLLDHDFIVQPTVPDGWRTNRADGAPAMSFTENGLELAPDQWLETVEPVAEISRRIAGSGAFTLSIEATTATLDQSGPARLLSISSDPFQRNLTVAQQGSDLVVRIRSPFTGSNGATPEYVVRDVFGGEPTHRIVIRYRASALEVSVDEPGRTTVIPLFPATGPMIDAFTDDIARVRFPTIGDWVRDAYLAALMFAPLAVTVAVLDAGRRSRASLLALVLVALVVPGVELMFSRLLPDQPFDSGRVLRVVAGALLVSLATSWSIWSIRSVRGGSEAARDGVPGDP